MIDSSYDPGEAIGRLGFTITTRNGDRRQRSDPASTQRRHSEHDVRSALSDAGFHDGEILDAHDVDLDDVGRSFLLCHKPTPEPSASTPRRSSVADGCKRDLS